MSLHDLFRSFCAYGDRSSSSAAMDGSKFAKFCRDCRVLNKRVTPTEVDITFSRVKRSRKISYPEFVTALEQLAVVRYPTLPPPEAFDKLQGHVLAAGGPATRGTTTNTAVGIYSKLTDTTLYTGAHRHRNPSGRASTTTNLRRGAKSSRSSTPAGHPGPAPRSQSTNDARRVVTSRPSSRPASRTSGRPASRSRSPRPPPGRRTPRSARSPRNSPPKPSASAPPTSAGAPSASGSGSGAGSGAASAWSDSPRDLFAVYLDYCAYGGPQSDLMDNARFMKLAKESGIVCRECSQTEVDITFQMVKDKGSRRINYDQFVKCLDTLAAKVFPSLSGEQQRMAIIQRIMSHGGPETRGTKASSDGVYGKLTNPSLYTGAHRSRFGKTAAPPTSPRTAASLPTFKPFRTADLKPVFLAYASFGLTNAGSYAEEIDNALFAKLAKECGLCTRRCPSTDVDIVFSKVKPLGARKITFDEFQTALGLIGKKSFPDVPAQRAFETVVRTVVAHGPPEARATAADASGVYGKLTDVSLYTGAHRHRAHSTDGGDAAAGGPDAGGGGGGGGGGPLPRAASNRSNRSSASHRSGGARHTYGPYRSADLKIIFQSYAAFGGATDFDNIDSSKVNKLAKECGLICVKLSAGEVDVAFSKVKSPGARKLSFQEFNQLLGTLGEKLFADSDPDDGYCRIVDAIIEHGPPEARTSTAADASGVYGKLTDYRQYTGAHRTRFHADGTGAGMNYGSSADLPERPKKHVKPAVDLDFEPFRTSELQPIFLDFCSFGGPEDDHIDNAKFAKLAKECGLTDARCTGIAVDIIFAKAKPHGARKLSWGGFLKALGMIGLKKFPEMEPEQAYYRVVDTICTHGGPEVRNVTAPKTTGVYQRMVDVSGYTGAHRARFNEDGSGAGLEEGTALGAKRRSFRDDAPALPKFGGYRNKELEAVYGLYCAFGGSVDTTSLDNAKMAKLARECGLVTSRVPPSEVDIVFSKVKTRGSRRITFSQFQQLLGVLGTKLHPAIDPETAFVRVVDSVVSQGAPAVEGTSADASGVYGKLTDASKYTGAHRARFNEDGTGAGSGVGNLEPEAPRSPRSAGDLPAFSAHRDHELYAVFTAYNDFGGNADADHMANNTFAKLTREAGLVAPSASTEVDVIFSKCKSLGARKLDFGQFKTALGLVAMKKLPSLDPQRAFSSIVDTVVARGGPVARGTAADASGVYGKLTDTSKYTGAHKHRFDSEGRGVGGGSVAPTHPGSSARTSTVSVEPITVSKPISLSAPGAAGGAGGAGSAPAYQRSRTSSTDPPGPSGSSSDAALVEVFKAFASFGGSRELRELDNAKFAKLTKECGLVSSRCTRADVDLVFSKAKAKGTRRLTYQQFQVALYMLAEKKYPQYGQREGYSKVVEKILASGGPKATGVTSTSTGSGVYARMTDAQQYTGAHRARFGVDARQ